MSSESFRRLSRECIQGEKTEMKNAQGREMECQEICGASEGRCGVPAEVIVDNGDLQPYWMCLPCADHNKRNRNAIVYFAKQRDCEP